MSPKAEPGLDDSVRVNQNNFPMCLTLNECAQFISSSREVWYCCQKVHSVFPVYLSFIKRVSRQANLSLVKLFFLPLNFFHSWLRCRRLNQAVRNQTAQLNVAGWNATCPQCLAIYYFPIYLFISIVATWVFAKKTYNPYVKVCSNLPQQMVANRISFLHYLIRC